MHPGMKYIALVSLCLLVKLGCIALLWSGSGFPAPHYCKGAPFSRLICSIYSGACIAYIGTDHPRTWDIGILPPIRMNIEPTTHYHISGYNADTEWAALAPNNGTLYLGLHHQPFSISLFHQLRCLDIIRRGVSEVLSQEESRLSRHCLNYVR
jgi:hypothetical protein